MSKGYRTKNTEASTSWAVNTLQMWMSCPNAEEGKESCPTDLLSTNDKASILQWVAQFVMEARRQHGSPTHQKQSTCLLYESALVQGVHDNIL